MKKSIILLATAALLSLGSCDLDINDNPNFPSGKTMTRDVMFPAVENAVAAAVGDQMFNYAGFFAQYFEQRPEANQYNNLAELQLDESSNLLDRTYSVLYAGALQDIKEVKTLTTNSHDLFALAVMRAYIYQLLVDNMDFAPYTEALQSHANTRPRWDDGETIYKGVLAEMDEAQANIVIEKDSMFTDPMLHKDVQQWIGFANALRLRMYLRLIDGGIDADAYTAKVKALVENGAFFTGDVAWDVYSNADGQYNPWYDSYKELGTINHVAAHPIVSYYLQTGDPRISYAIKQNSKETYVGQIPGAKTTMQAWTGKPWKNANVSAIDYTPATAMPVYLYTQSELQFLIAEVKLRFCGDDGGAKMAYENGVRADFASRRVKGVETFLEGAAVNWDLQADNTAKLNLIYMQKWAALFFRDHMEAWTEVRRTDVPQLSTATAEEVYKNPQSYVAGNMINPAVNYIVGGGLCKRVPYPALARQLNRNTPPAKLLSDRVFWDAK